MQRKTVLISIVGVFVVFAVAIVFLMFANSAKSPAPTVPINANITITGTAICLPHKNPGEVQTLECAYGLKGSDGKNYGLDDPDFKYLMNLAIGDTIVVTGTTAEAGNSNYDIVAKIVITKLEKAK